MTDRRPRVQLLVLPQPGKQSHLVMVIRPWRSKWTRATCAGPAKRCKAGECAHVKAVCAAVPRCRPEPMTKPDA